MRMKKINIFICGLLLLLHPIYTFAEDKDEGSLKGTDDDNAEVVKLDDEINTSSEAKSGLVDFNNSKFMDPLSDLDSKKESRVYNSLNLGNPGNVLSTYFTSTGTDVMYLGQSFQANYVVYKNYNNNSGIARAGNRLVLNDSMSTSKDFFFTLGTSSFSMQTTRPAATAWTVFNGAVPPSAPSYNNVRDGLSSMSIGSVPNSYSAVVVNPSYPNKNTSFFVNPAEASDPYSRQYVQGVYSDAYGRIKRVDGTQWSSAIYYTGVNNNGNLISMNTPIIVKYTARERRLDLYAVAAQSTNTTNRMLLGSWNIPTNWSSLRLMWSSVTGEQANLNYMGWVINSGYQDLTIPVIYRYNGREIYRSGFSDWLLYYAYNFDVARATQLANDEIRNNYQITNISGGIPNRTITYADVLPTNTLQSRPIYVDLADKPKVDSTFNVIAYNSETNQQINNLGTYKVTVDNYGDPIDISNYPNIVSGKNSLTQSGWILDKVTQTTSDGREIAATESNIITQNQTFTVKYWYKPKTSKINVSFVDESNNKLSDDIVITAKVPDGNVDLTKNSLVTNKLIELTNSNYSIVSRPPNEKNINPGSDTSVRYVLKKNRNTIMDPDDGVTSFKPVTPDNINKPQNTTTEDLRIQYISDFDFGIHKKSSKRLSVNSNGDKGVPDKGVVKDVPVFVSIIDDRSSSTGWTLSARRDEFVNSDNGDTLSAAQLILSDFVYNSNAIEKPKLPTKDVTITNQASIISSSSINAAKNKSWSLSFGSLTNDKKSTGVSFTLPVNTPVNLGQYSTNISWNLSPNITNP